MEKTLNLRRGGGMVDYTTVCRQASMGDEDLDIWRNIVFYT